MKYLLVALFLMVSSVTQAAEVLPGPYKVIVHSVYDGDTLTAIVRIWLGQTVTIKVRINEIDTPEIRTKCVDEKVKAYAAKEALEDLLTGNVEIKNVRYGKYAGRVVAVVTVNGANVGDMMIDRGHAVFYDGKSERKNWCETLD